MGTREEGFVRSLLDSLAAADRDAAAEHFSENAVYHVNAWHEPVNGRDAVRAELERQAGIYTDFRYQIVNIASTASLVFTERVDSMTIAGKDVTLHWASAHEVNAAGEVVACRDYYDMKELEVQLSG
jgi:limonene-1,2-epoxide hydrolase